MSWEIKGLDAVVFVHFFLKLGVYSPAIWNTPKCSTRKPKYFGFLDKEAMKKCDSWLFVNGECPLSRY